MGRRRALAVFSSRRKSHPATALARSIRSNYGGNEMVEAFREACHELVTSLQPEGPLMAESHRGRLTF